MAHPAPLKPTLLALPVLLGLACSTALAADTMADWKQYTLTSLVMAEDRAAAGKSLSFPLPCQNLPANTRQPASLKSCQLMMDPSGNGFKATGVSKSGQTYAVTSTGIRKKNSGVNVDLVRMSYQFLQDTQLQSYVLQTRLNVALYLTGHQSLEGVFGPCAKVPRNAKLPPEVLRCEVLKSKSTFTIQASGIRGTVATVTGSTGTIKLKPAAEKP
ncbi:hypothetical protein [Deinococcus roseus]|uniref:DUF306 domain-containing protein n=1 Tax=Deinococcus roseus TaxID=392414 RepID=A0ABQ2D7R7_9DEIO|nr:hypothetical protein [Deinococcus roseus]GGJ49016.1 hypothetical protein GCM10008938_38750 [Deinococcus roseus]